MKSKIQELKEAIGKEFSYNGSPTLRAKLIKVNKATCVLEVAPGKYLKDSIQHTWNAIYY